MQSPTRRREHVLDEYTLICLLYVSLLGCLTPFLLDDWQITVDDDYSNTTHNDFWFMALCLSCLMVTIPSAIDTAFDLFYQLSHFLTIIVNKTAATATKTAPSNVLRMTHIERAGFMLACASSSLICFLPNSCGSTTQILVFNCTSNCSCILATFQLLKFLNRVTKTFGYWLVLFIYVNTCLGAVLSSISLAYMGRTDPISEQLYQTIATASAAFIIVAAGTYMAAFLASIVYFCHTYNWSFSQIKTMLLAYYHSATHTGNTSVESATKQTAAYRGRIPLINPLLLLLFLLPSPPSPYNTTYNPPFHYHHHAITLLDCYLIVD